MAEGVGCGILTPKDHACYMIALGFDEWEGDTEYIQTLEAHYRESASCRAACLAIYQTIAPELEEEMGQGFTLNLMEGLY